MQKKLIERAAAMGLSLTDAQADSFAKYHEMLIEANRQMNLTRVADDPDEAVDRNYLDCVTPLTTSLFDNCRRAADVGSGAGFPGIPLAILLPDVEFTLLDALDKRVKFLNEVIDNLHLNAKAVHLRAEEAGRNPALRDSFDVATSRAVASLNVLCEFSLPLVRPGGRMIAYKGPAWEEERDSAANALEKLNGRFVKAWSASVPGRDWNHVLVEIEKTAATPETYPRRSGMPEKRPL